MGVERHVQHIRTTDLEYTPIDRSIVPVNAVVLSTDTLPNPDGGNAERYVVIGSQYYELTGKKPYSADIKEGEIAVSFADGNERLFIKNSNGTIVEFRPYRTDRYVAYMFQKDNEVMNPIGSVCTWEIGYDELKDKGVSPNCASVALREVFTGKQTVPDVVFDENDNKVKIDIYSETQIGTGEYRVVITGLNYGE